MSSPQHQQQQLNLIKSNVPTIQWRFGQDQEAVKQQQKLNKYLNHNKKSRKEVIDSIFKSRKEQFDRSIDIQINEQLSDDDSALGYKDEEDMTRQQDNDHKTIQEPYTPPSHDEEEDETMLMLERMRQTGAEFNTRDLKQFLLQARKKQLNLRNNQHAPLLSVTAPSTSPLMNLSPEEEAQLEEDLKMLPDIEFKRKSNLPLHSDDKKVLEMQRIKVQMIMFKRKIQE